MENKRQAQSEGERLKTVLDLLFLSAHKLSKVLNFKSPSSVYHIIDGRNRLTPDTIEGIVKAFPKVSYVYLRNGKGEPLLTSQTEIDNQLKSLGIQKGSSEKEPENRQQIQSDPLRYNVATQLQQLIDNSEKLNGLVETLIEENKELRNILERKDAN